MDSITFNSSIILSSTSSQDIMMKTGLLFSSLFMAYMFVTIGEGKKKVDPGKPCKDYCKKKQGNFSSYLIRH